jgi:hypothetical protein
MSLIIIYISLAIYASFLPFNLLILLISFTLQILKIICLGKKKSRIIDYETKNEYKNVPITKTVTGTHYIPEYNSVKNNSNSIIKKEYDMLVPNSRMELQKVTEYVEKPYPYTVIENGSTVWKTEYRQEVEYNYKPTIINEIVPKKSEYFVNKNDGSTNNVTYKEVYGTYQYPSVERKLFNVINPVYNHYYEKVDCCDLQSILIDPFKYAFNFMLNSLKIILPIYSIAHILVLTIMSFLMIIQIIKSESSDLLLILYIPATIIFNLIILVICIIIFIVNKLTK